jgi:hypothetical protein
MRLRWGPAWLLSGGANVTSCLNRLMTYLSTFDATSDGACAPYFLAFYRLDWDVRQSTSMWAREMAESQIFVMRLSCKTDGCSLYWAMVVLLRQSKEEGRRRVTMPLIWSSVLERAAEDSSQVQALYLNKAMGWMISWASPLSSLQLQLRPFALRESHPRRRIPKVSGVPASGLQAQAVSHRLHGKSGC